MIIRTNDLKATQVTEASNGRYPRIAPLMAGKKRPFWSVMIPIYNPDPDFLEMTILSVLQQDAGIEKMQIELVDDCSDNFEAEAFLARFEPGRISYHRNEKQLGIGGNWNKCIERARGQWVHILHQDDVILRDFYSKLRVGIEQSTNIGAAFSQHYVMDSDGLCRLRSRLRQRKAGILKKWLQYIFVDMSVQTATIVVNRKVYEKLGGFSLKNQYTLDWDMWKRIAANYSIWFDPQPLACYRLHNRSTTSKLILTGKNIAEISACIDDSKALLPEAVAKRITKASKKYYTMYAVELGLERLLVGDDLVTAITQLREAKKLSSLYEVVRAVFVVTVRGCFRFFKSAVKHKTKVNKSTFLNLPNESK